MWMPMPMWECGGHGNGVRITVVASKQIDEDVVREQQERMQR